ncbi:MAG: PilZ domain-containing protein [gamma proteobacterium endosymbiont of Lamellibrachia anaximandri]|nr:PilZ domain-containing protein [gamma proteobacterium endosymbiont of Lamellibrachia anaximandri]MBL3617251.1 PilZ domain-containing protein [gamma proteobacterium endosymbiont of Lamellibrachia anaximandri]
MTTSGKSEERRRFRRVLFDAPMRISVGDKSYETTLVDLSLKGALAVRPADWSGQPDQSVELDIKLGDTETRIRMQASVAHIGEGAIGFRCNTIDMESITHLRRLVELNTGDAELLERELEALA